MDATALRMPHAPTPATIGGGVATTNSTTTTPAGPSPAPAQPTLLGVRLLPAPAGQPQPIHMPDGSTLVPLARVKPDGTRVPIAGGGGAASTPTTPSAAAPAALPPAGFEPRGFLYDDRYFRKFHDAGGIALTDSNAVEERLVRSTFAYLLEEEQRVDDFGVTRVDVRAVDPVRDADLLRINPRAHFIADVHGVQGDGVVRAIPSVMNGDGAVFVDPRIRGGG